MAKIVVNIKGLDALKRRLNKTSEDIKRYAMDAVDEITTGIQEEAIRNAPAIGDPIDLINGTMSSPYNLQSIIEKKLEAGSLTGWVYIAGGEDENKMSAYVNFGTGDDASKYLPSLSIYWQDMARKYYIDGKGRIVHNPYFTNAVFKFEDQAISIVKKHIEKVK